MIFTLPLHSDVPVLLLSGGIRSGHAAGEMGRRPEAGLTNSLHLVLPDLGHGQIGVTCMDRVMARLHPARNGEGLDASCTRRPKPMPFFMTLSGPTP